MDRSYSFAILMGLQRKPIYQGTVTDAEKKRRRAAGKRAKIARRLNRG